MNFIHESYNFLFKMEFTYLQLFVTSTTVLLTFVAVSYLFYKTKRKERYAAEAFKYLSIKIVSNEVDCKKVVHELRMRCRRHQAMGFDCEWVSINGSRQPVALLQLSTFDGYCGLFRLNDLKSVPTSLNDLLEDKTIYKVGVVPRNDGQYLHCDYSTSLQSSLDLRHLAHLCGYHAGGLASLSKTVLGVILDKSWRVRASDWEAEQLTEKQVNYAAADAHVAIKIFVKIVNKLNTKKIWNIFNKEKDDIWDHLDELCRPYADVSFSVKLMESRNNKITKEKKNKSSVPRKKFMPMTRNKPLYHNCFLQAPDGELLCTCDNKKAMWYVEKQLADIEVKEPLTVRLRFEPAGRSVGDVGRYYQLAKENKCVICGVANSYIRKNVVPREYRKSFPEIMKDHSSHDVVLLCVSCHQRSNITDVNMRSRLAELCSAPVGAKDCGRYIEDAAVKKIRSAARALLIQSRKHTLPPARRQELEALLLQHYPQHEEVTPQLLEEASHVQVVFENSDYESHGQKVVDYFAAQEGGLLRLEEMWRKHFLETMRPKYMPALWSVKHNEERLLVRMKEGRLSEQEIKLLGLARRTL